MPPLQSTVGISRWLRARPIILKITRLLKGFGADGCGSFLRKNH